MANLAIRGHTTKGNKVIEILEMLGGKTSDRELYGNVPHYGYYILDNGYVSLKHCSLFKNAIFFTLEEFLERFPYKVGDKVLYKYDKKTYFIRKIFWKNDKILYELSDEVYSEGCSMPDTIIFDVDVIKLQPYKEETMKETIKIDIPKGYEFAGVDDDKQQVVFEKIGCQYPNTYEECCKILLLKPERATYSVSGLEYKRHLIVNIQRLIICRDAYWKLCGTPDTKSNECCCLYYDITDDDILKELGPFDVNSVLVFPTQEICDMFYDNFEELIKECKSLL